MAKIYAHNTMSQKKCIAKFCFFLFWVQYLEHMHLYIGTNKFLIPKNVIVVSMYPLLQIWNKKKMIMDIICVYNIFKSYIFKK